MTLHSVNEAARLAGKSPRTLYKHVHAGTLSAQRSPGGALRIDTSELIRAYGEIHDPESQDATDGHSHSQQMQAEINRLEALLRERDQVNELLRQQNSQLVRLLEDQSGSKKTAFSTLTEALADRIRGR